MCEMKGEADAPRRMVVKRIISISISYGENAGRPHWKRLEETGRESEERTERTG